MKSVYAAEREVKYLGSKNTNSGSKIQIQVQKIQIQVQKIRLSLGSDVSFFFQCHHMSLMDFVVSPPGCGRSVTDF
jgi:hypothetical protein